MSWKIFEVRNEPPDYWPHHWIATPLGGDPELEEYFDTYDEAVAYVRGQERKSLGGLLRRFLVR